MRFTTKEAPGALIRSAFYSKDNRRIVTAETDGARIWDASTGDLLATLPHADVVFKARFSPDGQMVATSSWDNTVKIWNTQTGELLHTLSRGSEDDNRYSDFNWRPDGGAVAVGRPRRSLADVWSIPSGAFLGSLPSAAGHIVTYSGDGRWLALISPDSDAVQVWDAHTLRLVVSLPVYRSMHAAFDSTGDRIVTASGAGHLALWRLPSGERIHTLQESGDRIHDVMFSPDDAWLATAETNDTLRVWDAATGQLHRAFREGRGDVSVVAFDPHSRLVAMEGKTGAVVVEIATGRRIARFGDSFGALSGIQFDGTGRRVLTTTTDKTARVWEIADSEYRFASPQIETQACGQGTFSMNHSSRYILVPCSSAAYVWDTDTDRLLAKLPIGPDPWGLARMSLDGKHVAIANDKHVLLYALDDPEHPREIHHPASLTELAFSADGLSLASASSDGSLLVTRGGATRQLSSGGRKITGLIFLDKAQHLLVARPRMLQLYKLDDGGELAAWDNPLQTDVRAFRVSSDEAKVLTMSEPRYPDTEAPVLWNLPGRRMIAPLAVTDKQIYSARFIDQERAILTTSSAGGTQIMSASTGLPMRTIIKGYALDATLDPNGDFVVVSNNGQVVFVDPASGENIWSFAAHRGTINSLRYTGSSLYTQSHDGDIARWEITPLPSDDALMRIRDCLATRLSPETATLTAQTACPGGPQRWRRR